MPEKTPKYIVICERKSDAPNAIRNIKGAKIKFIAATPEACYELTNVGIKYSDIESYYPPGGGDTPEIYDKVQKMCKDIDAENKFNAGMDNFYFIKLLYDTLYVKTATLKTIIDKEKPDKIITFEYENPPENRNLQHPFTDWDNVYAELLRSGKFKCEYQVYKRPKVTFGKNSNTEKKRDVPPALYNILYCMKHRGFGEGVKMLFYLARNKIRGEKKLLAMSKYNYGWQQIIPELYKNGFALINFDVSEFATPFTGEPTKNLESVRKYCVTGGVDFGEIFTRILRKKIAMYDNDKEMVYNAARLAIKSYKPYAMIGSSKASYKEHLMAKAASDFWIPVVTWQHGAAYPPNYSMMLPFNETLDSDIHLTFGEGYEAFKKFGCITVPVGSYNLEKLFFMSGRTRKEFDVLYATTLYNGNLYTSTSIDNKLWRAQKAILDTLAKQKHLKIAVKLHPSSRDDHVLYRYMRDNIEIFKNERTYLDLMRHAKVVVVDYPSTTMLEAIAAGKEVIVLSDQVKLTPEQTELLKRRAYVASSLDEFILMLDRYMRGDVTENPPDRKDTAFLNCYGTYALDGHVTNRVIEALKEAGGAGPIEAHPPLQHETPRTTADVMDEKADKPTMLKRVRAALKNEPKN